MTLTLEGSPPGRSCAEASLLLREYSHRINNEFASAISVISCAARSSTGEAKSTLAAVKDLLFNYAQVHHVLQMPEESIRVDAAAYLRQLCRAISRSKLDGKRIELFFVTPKKCWMNSERCWQLGLMVSELITNSARHAFGESGGVIRVELLPSTSFVECRVTDNGVSDSNIRPGRGLRIVAALARSLGGRIDQHFGPQGTASVMVFPAAEAPSIAACKLAIAKKRKKA